jgi:hypothetical protein
LQHDLAARIDLATTSGLRLRKRTIAHLHTITDNREYLVTRYGPEMTATVSQIKRLTATLEEVAAKVTAIVSTKQSATCSPAVLPVPSRPAP